MTCVVSKTSHSCYSGIDILTEISIYRDNLLPIIAIAQNSLDLSTTDIAFVIYFVTGR